MLIIHFKLQMTKKGLDSSRIQTDGVLEKNY